MGLWVLAVLAAMAGSLAQASRAEAQPARGRTTELTKTDADFERGLEALRAGDPREAARAFEASYRASPRTRTLLNLGIAYTSLGQLERAIAAFEAFVHFADPEHDAQNIAAVRRELERLRDVSASARPAPHDDADTSPQPKGSTTSERDAPCALGQICVGPMLSLGPPNLIGVGLHFRFGEHLGLATDLAFLPTTPIHIASVSTMHFSTQLRVFPFGGWFFLSAGFAHQWISGSASEMGVTVDAQSRVPAMAFGLGLVGRDGFVLGIDLSLLVRLEADRITVRAGGLPPEAAQLSEAQRAQVIAEAEGAVHDVLELLPVLFQLNVVRLGFLF